MRLSKSKQESRINVSRLQAQDKNSKSSQYKELRKQYAFLEYASENWLSHTSNFTVETQTWKMWKQLVAADTQFITQPWTANDWAHGNDKIMHYIVDNNHMALLLAMLETKWRLKCLSILESAIKKRLLNLVNIILKSHTLTEYGLGGALQAAVADGLLEAVERFLAAKADVNVAPAVKDGRTALQAAAEGGNLEIVERLLAAKADVDAAPAGNNGRTVLQAAAEGGHVEIVERLKRAKAQK